MNEKSIKVLITGSGGFLGGYLIKELLKDDRYQIVAMTSDPVKLRDRYYDQNLKIIDKTNFVLDKIDLEDIDVLIHCAFAIQSDERCLIDSLAFTKLVFTKARSAKIPNIINISSRSVYGDDQQLLCQEDTTVCLKTPYAKAKYESELLLQQIFDDTDINHTNIRLASLIGPEFDVRFINKFVKQVIEYKPITIVDQDQRFAFLDVKDASIALVKMLDNLNIKWHHIYNLGHFKIYSIIEIAQIIKDIAKRSYGITVMIKVDEGFSHHQSIMDCQAFYQDFNWRPQFDIQDSLKMIFDYYHNN
ncbi:MAG: NAD(P)-dependent oxidoreductase [Erysipelotrichaceae bacterium]|nr:NAD(P)-dependent oxidoreductase [Erysipelotrichaceae bacterium]